MYSKTVSICTEIDYFKFIFKIHNISLCHNAAVEQIVIALPCFIICVLRQPSVSLGWWVVPYWASSVWECSSPGQTQL